jgi:hypothetical protein
VAVAAVVTGTVIHSSAPCAVFMQVSKSLLVVSEDRC